MHKTKLSKEQMCYVLNMDPALYDSVKEALKVWRRRFILNKLIKKLWKN